MPSPNALATAEGIVGTHTKPELAVAPEDQGTNVVKLIFCLLENSLALPIPVVNDLQWAGIELFSFFISTIFPLPEKNVALPDPRRLR